MSNTKNPDNSTDIINMVQPVQEDDYHRFSEHARSVPTVDVIPVTTTNTTDSSQQPADTEVITSNDKTK